MRSDFARLLPALSLLGLAASACAEPDDSSDGPVQCVAGQLCPDGLVCIQGFCLNAGMSDDETGDGDGDPTTGDGDGDGDGDPTTGDGDGDPTTGDGDGDPTTGDGDGDPTTGDGDGDGDPWGGDPSPTNLWPLAVGATWTFQIDPGTGCNGGNTQTWVLSGMEQHVGYSSYIVSVCGLARTHLRLEDGDLYISHYDNPWLLFMKAPVSNGATWMNGSDNYQWLNAGSLNTPAGTFESCWTKLYQSLGIEETFCQGVGPVELYTLGALLEYSIP